MLNSKYFEAMYRFAIGAPLFNAPWLESVKTAIASSGVASAAAKRALDEVDAYFEDAAGFVPSNAPEEASTAAHIAYGKAVDAVLALAGEYQPNSKWRARRLREVKPELLAAYWGVFTMAE